VPNSLDSRSTYKMRLKLSECLVPLKDFGNCIDGYYAVERLVRIIDTKAMKDLASCPDLYVLMMRANVSQCVGLAVRDAIKNYSSLDKLYDSMSLGEDRKALTPREAYGIFDTVHGRMQRSYPSEKNLINGELLGWVCKLSKRPLRVIEGCTTRDEIAERLCAGGPDHFLSGLAVHLGKELTEFEGGSFYASYREKLATMEQQNESGDWSKFASSKKAAARSPEEYRQYCMGKLPMDHMEILCRRDVTRDFLKQCFEIIH
jgi:hypothetical protein